MRKTGREGAKQSLSSNDSDDENEPQKHDKMINLEQYVSISLNRHISELWISKYLIASLGERLFEDNDEVFLVSSF